MDPLIPIGTGLDAVRVRRAELFESVSALEHALSTPAVEREVVWGEALHAALEGVAFDWAAHIDVTEGPNGLHQSILGGDLRLSNAVDSLTRDHADLAAEIAGLLRDSEPPVTGTDLDGLRERGTQLIAHLIAHRQRGADLVYEAYQTDIGGGD